LELGPDELGTNRDVTFVIHTNDEIDIRIAKYELLYYRHRLDLTAAPSGFQILDLSLELFGRPSPSPSPRTSLKSES
jgi:hypothetical protein